MTEKDFIKDGFDFDKMVNDMEKEANTEIKIKPNGGLDVDKLNKEIKKDKKIANKKRKDSKKRLDTLDDFFTRQGNSNLGKDTKNDMRHLENNSRKKESIFKKLLPNKKK